VILNGAPRSGKSQIARAIQDHVSGHWMNLGVDVARAMTPPGLQPGIGLRPGEPDHPAARYVAQLYAALYESVAAHARLGFDVVVDVGHYDRAILADAAQRLAGLPVLFVGINCPIDVIMDRRRASAPGTYETAAGTDDAPAPVLRWQNQVHGGWRYDLELDTSVSSPAQAAAEIGAHLESDAPLTAFEELRRPKA
jgi:chloramphenicol 3-O phosphotransferase